MFMSPTFKRKRFLQMDKDIFGFAEAIRIDDLSDEDFKIVELIFKDFK